MLVLPLVILMQVMPPPFGTIVGALVLGRAHDPREIVEAVPLPAPPAEDCDCGVPASPRGPR